MVRNQAKEFQDQKIASPIKERQVLDISSSHADFPNTELGVTLDRPSRAEMLLFILKLLLCTKKNNIFSPLDKRFLSSSSA